MDDYSTYNPSNRTTFYEIDPKKGVLDDNPLKSRDFVDGKFYTSKPNASSYSAGNEVLVAFIKNGEYYSFKRTKDTLFSDNALDTSSVGAFGFKSIYALGSEIGCVICNNRVIWQKPRLASNTIPNATLYFDNFYVGGRFRYGVKITKANMDVVEVYQSSQAKQFNYGEKTVPILDSLVTGGQLVLILDDPDKPHLYRTITQKMVYFE